MIDFALHRTKLESRIAEARAAKQPQLLSEDNTCKHEWHRFKQTIHADNDKFPGIAYFIVKACIKCYTKHTTDYSCTL